MNNHEFNIQGLYCHYAITTKCGGVTRLSEKVKIEKIKMYVQVVFCFVFHRNIAHIKIKLKNKISSLKDLKHLYICRIKLN